MIRRIGFLSSLVLTALLGCQPRRAQVETAPKGNAWAIANATVIDVKSGVALQERTILIGGSRIVQVGPSNKVSAPSSCAVIDGRGTFVIPGLWDMHVHTGPKEVRLAPAAQRGIAQTVRCAFRERTGRREEHVRRRREPSGGL